MIGNYNLLHSSKGEFHTQCVQVPTDHLKFHSEPSGGAEVSSPLWAETATAHGTHPRTTVCLSLQAAQELHTWLGKALGLESTP